MAVVSFLGQHPLDPVSCTQSQEEKASDEAAISVIERRPKSVLGDLAFYSQLGQAALMTWVGAKLAPKRAKHCDSVASLLPLPPYSNGPDTPSLSHASVLAVLSSMPFIRVSHTETANTQQGVSWQIGRRAMCRRDGDGECMAKGGNIMDVHLMEWEDRKGAVTGNQRE